MGSIPISSAQIVGLFMESIFYGLYLVTCWFCGARLLRNAETSSWRRARDLNWLMLIVAILLFSVATVDLALGLYRNIIAFVYYNGPGGATGHFTDISSWVNVMKTVTLNIQTLLGDAILIYRCFVVYERSWKIIVLPIILWIACCFTAVRQSMIEAELRQSVMINAKQLLPYIIAFWALTIAQNFMTTGLVVWRIWNVNRKFGASVISNTSSNTNPLGSQRNNRLNRAIVIIVESGLLFTTIALITFITVLCNNTGLYPTSDMEVITVGIAFNLIIIRSQNRPRPSAAQNSMILPFSSRDRVGVRANTFEPKSRNGTGPGAIEIFVKQGVEQHDMELYRR